MGLVGGVLKLLFGGCGVLLLFGGCDVMILFRLVMLKLVIGLFGVIVVVLGVMWKVMSIFCFGFR